MALTADIKINGNLIGELVLTRRGPVPANGISEYNVVYSDFNAGTYHRARVTHHYPDGAAVLVTKALQVLEGTISGTPEYLVEHYMKGADPP